MPRRCAAKHSQWWALNRRVASLVVEQPPEYLELWRTCEVPDEHYFLTTVRHRRVESLDDFWDAGAPSTPDDVACHRAGAALDLT